MIVIEVNNLTEYSISSISIRTTLKKAFKKLKIKEFYLSVALVSKKEIHRLNRVYRKVDKPTDVLSLSLGENEGEIIICPAVIREQKENLKTVLLHGLLHILGHKHKKKKDKIRMERLTQKLLYEF